MSMSGNLLTPCQETLAAPLHTAVCPYTCYFATSQIPSKWIGVIKQPLGFFIVSEAGLRL